MVAGRPSARKVTVAPGVATGDRFGAHHTETEPGEVAIGPHRRDATQRVADTCLDPCPIGQLATVLLEDLARELGRSGAAPCGVAVTKPMSKFVGAPSAGHGRAAVPKYCVSFMKVQNRISESAAPQPLAAAMLNTSISYRPCSTCGSVA